MNNNTYKDRLCEFKSDYLALEITLSCNLDKNWGIVGSYIGIDFMFDCMELLNQVNFANFQDSHPTISHRKAVLRKLFQDLFPEYFNKICNISDINYNLLMSLWSKHKKEIQES